ncbi:hypothetical protein WJX79_001362 [Trebouxia sp. C0005]|nr:MAG: hypothetical protein FRX49_13724 [Trebouxia sp. A1-2]
MQKAMVSTPMVTCVPRRPVLARVVVKAQQTDCAPRRAAPLAVIIPAMAAAMLMVSGPSEAKMHAGKAGNASESSQGGYDMTGTKHRGLKPGQRKELLASAKEEAQNLQKGIKKAVKSE